MLYLRTMDIMVEVSNTLSSRFRAVSAANSEAVKSSDPQAPRADAAASALLRARAPSLRGATIDAMSISSTLTESTMGLEEALILAREYGFPVFPCRLDKTPYTAHGFKDASGTSAKIVSGSSIDVVLGHLTAFKTGTYRRRCPNCNRDRRDDALAITVNPDGRIVYFCHRCHLSGWDGGREHRPNVTLPRCTVQRQSLSDYGRELWKAACPIAGEARAYLESRHCVLPPADGHLRWCERLRHPCGHIGPALVALVTDAVTGASMSLHRTWITASGRKAAIESPRLLLAAHRKTGGVIRLWPDKDVTCRLGVAEGIETALAAAHGFTPIWAAIDAGNLGALPLLPAIESLTIFADHDDVGLRAAVRLASRWAEAGREVLVVTPEREGHDIADEVNT